LGLNDKPSRNNASFSFGMDEGPIPCNDRISFSLNSDSLCRVVIPWFSSARLAGAPNTDRKLFSAGIVIYILFRDTKVKRIDLAAPGENMPYYYTICATELFSVN